ncbi:MAG: restriction endonuclease subunit S [Deltaproteobacteria bacterium]|jgi:type I restriction enzyme S subunit|nr:restriction endonuclease subunit S [Deltaproteobacteria bacterium]
MKIKKISAQIRGVSCKHENASEIQIDGRAPLLRARNRQDDGQNLKRLPHFDIGKVKPKHHIKMNDIRTSSGSLRFVGKAAQATRDYDVVFGTFCKVARPDRSVCAEYIWLFFRSDHYRDNMASVSEGANINDIRAEHADDITIPLPSLDEQRKIAAVLDATNCLFVERKRQLEQPDLTVKSKFVPKYLKILETAG